MLNENHVLDLIMDFVENFPGVDISEPVGQVALADYISERYPGHDNAAAQLDKFAARVSYGTNGMDPNIEGIKKAARYLRNHDVQI